MSRDKTTKLLNQLRALLAKAESTEHEKEAELFRAKAGELMRQYRLSADDLDDGDKAALETRTYTPSELGFVQYVPDFVYGFASIPRELGVYSYWHSERQDVTSIFSWGFHHNSI